MLRLLYTDGTTAMYKWFAAVGECFCPVCMSICVMLLLLFVNMALTANKCWCYLWLLCANVAAVFAINPHIRIYVCLVLRYVDVHILVMLHRKRR